MIRVVLIGCLLGLLGFACQEDLEAISQVTKFRVLAVQTDPPEVNPGESVALRVLVADPDPDPAAPKFGPPHRRITAVGLAVSGLVTPSSAEIEEPDLAWPPFVATADGDGVIDLAVLGVPPDVTELITAEQPELVVTAVLLICAGGDDGVQNALLQALLAAGQDSGLDNPGDLVEVCTTGGADEGIVAFKTFDITDRLPGDGNRNANPEISHVVFDDKDFLGVPDDGYEPVFQCTGSDGCREGVLLEAYLAQESFQIYEKVVFGEVEVTDERLYVSWFTTGGGFTADRSGNDGTSEDPFENDWLPPRDGGRFQLWVVAHDIRGGVSWVRHEIEAVTP
ncbi:MAG TPA: hypothetical protein VM285_06265 [Polyangia bacterium]|nr:hypothetical protein [Polyangia bacterium]